jgi:hypothetical protein
MAKGIHSKYNHATMFSTNAQANPLQARYLEITVYRPLYHRSPEDVSRTTVSLGMLFYKLESGLNRYRCRIIGQVKR